MAFLAGWSFRKSKIVNGTAAGAQTNYDVSITINAGVGVDNATNMYLNGNGSFADFRDIRFTQSDGTTLLNYWIDPDFLVAGVSALVWIQISSIPASPGTTSIYLYYGNASAVSASNGRNTFITFDDFSTGSVEQWTIANGGAQLSIDRVTNHRIDYTNLDRTTANKAVYIDKAADIGNWFLYNKLRITSGGSIFSIGFASTLGDMNNTQGLYQVNDQWIAGGQLNIGIGRTNGASGFTQNNGGYIAAYNTTYYCTLSKNGTSTQLNVYTDAQRTVNVNTTNLVITELPNPKSRYMYAIAGWSGGGAQTTTGWLTNIVVRPFASPEPTFGASGSQETAPVILIIKTLTRVV